MSDHDEVIFAKAEAEQARARFRATAEQLRARLTPKALAEDAADSARQGALKLGMTSLEAARQRPGVAGGVAGLLLAALLWRWRRAAKAKTSPGRTEHDRHAQH